MANSNGQTEQAARKPTPDPERDDRVHFAMQYMLAARRKATPVNGEVASPKSSPVRMKETVLSSTALESIEAAVKTTKDTLQYHGPWKDLDDDVNSVYGAALTLNETLKKFMATVELDGIIHHDSSKTALESIESCKEAINSLIPRVLSTESTRLPEQLTSPDTPLQHLKEYRRGMVDSFRQRTRIRLRHTVVELRETCISVSEMLKPVPNALEEAPPPIQIQMPTLSPIEEQAPVVLPDLKLPPLKPIGRSKTCKSCAKIFHLRDSWLTREESSFQPSISFRSNVRKLLLSAEQGCQFCRLQLTKLFKLGPVSMNIIRVEVNWWKFWDGDYHSHDDWEDDSYSKDFRIRYLSAARETISDDYYITKPVTDGEVRTIASSTNSRESLAVAKNWIRTCLYSHTSCNRQALKNLNRPTRLIFLGVENSREARIVEQKEVSRSVKYMTLSHRWRDTKQIQLTTVNYSEFKSRIDDASLPKTFLDAMETARRLGIFYLWIDCLCILQDSTEDWQYESAQMSDIYAGSWCNIAATRVVDDSQGLHAERSPLEIQGCIIRDIGYASSFKVEGNDDGARAWESSIQNSQLMNRGWVMQEITMAPRTIHFAHDRLYWQCSTQKASESSPTELDMSRKRYHPKILPADEKFHGPPGWAAIVHQYSRCKLTFPAKDKLVAISGIAEKYGEDADYLAGLWKPNLLLQLIWRVARPEETEPKRTEYQAPSWSWASINKEVRYSERVGKPRTNQMLAKVLNTNMTLESDYALGKVTRGALTIRGSLARLQYKGKRSSINKGPILPGKPFNLLPRNIPVSLDLDFNDDIADDTIFYCLPLYFDIVGKLRENVYGLILEPTGRKGEFVRRGTMVLGEKSMCGGGGVGVWDVVRFVGCCKEGEGDIGEEIYKEKVGEGWGLPMFVVTLV